MDIVPLCLYINEQSDTNFINYPSKIRTENQTKISCLEKYGYGSKTFFVINPDFRPIPVGAALFSFKNGTSRTVSLEIAYDPFNITEKSYRFIAWLEPIPHSVPIYIFKSIQSSSLFFSLKNVAPPGYEPNSDIKIIYVLEPSEKYFFENYQGRCIPSKNSNLTLRQCLSQNRVSKDVDILNYIPVSENNTKPKYIILTLIVILFLFFKNKWISKR